MTIYFNAPKYYNQIVDTFIDDINLGTVH